jgi:hypothetical protein
VHDTITVIASGWSAGSERKPPKGIGHIIGVNDAGLIAGCDDLVSMDRLYVEHRWPQIKARAELAWLRRSALKNISDRPAWLKVFDNDHTSTEPSTEYGRLNGTSSGMCALNLALMALPKRIVLIGFDMNRSPDGRAYWHAPYEWTKAEGATSGGKYKAWAGQFGAFAAGCRDVGIEVLNTSLTSAITAFPKMALEKLR